MRGIPEAQLQFHWDYIKVIVVGLIPQNVELMP